MLYCLIFDTVNKVILTSSTDLDGISHIKVIYIIGSPPILFVINLGLVAMNSHGCNISSSC